MSKGSLTLYITGHTNRSESAINNLNSLHKNYLLDTFEVSVVDTLENPSQAEADNILATPTLIKHSSTGDIRIIGDLSNTNQILQLLGLRDNKNINSEDKNGKNQ